MKPSFKISKKRKELNKKHGPILYRCYKIVVRYQNPKRRWGYKCLLFSKHAHCVPIMNLCFCRDLFIICPAVDMAEFWASNTQSSVYLYHLPEDTASNRCVLIQTHDTRQTTFINKYNFIEHQGCTVYNSVYNNKESFHCFIMSILGYLEISYMFV